MRDVRSYPLSMLFLAICASVFAVAQLTDVENVRFLALDSAMFPERWWTIVTTGFVHVEWNHIIVNMLLLLWVGTWVERLIGSRRFAVLVFTAILAGALSILVRDTAGIGFSAAAAAIVFYYHVAFPFERELPLRIPNIVLPVVLFVGSLAAAVFGWFEGVGHWPHLAGAVVGLLFLVVFRRHHRTLEDDEPQPAALHD